MASLTRPHRPALLGYEAVDVPFPFVMGDSNRKFEGLARSNSATVLDGVHSQGGYYYAIGAERGRGTPKGVSGVDMTAGETAVELWVWAPPPPTFPDDPYLGQGEEAWNKLVDASPNRILRRECLGCAETHQTIYYRRLTDFSVFSNWTKVRSPHPSETGRDGRDRRSTECGTVRARQRQRTLAVRHLGSPTAGPGREGRHGRHTRP